MVGERERQRERERERERERRDGSDVTIVAAEIDGELTHSRAQNSYFSSQMVCIVALAKISFLPFLHSEMIIIVAMNNTFRCQKFVLFVSPLSNCATSGRRSKQSNVRLHRHFFPSKKSKQVSTKKYWK